MNPRLIGSPLTSSLRPFQKLTTMSVGPDDRHRHSPDALYQQPSQRFRFFLPAWFPVSPARAVYSQSGYAGFHVPRPTYVGFMEGFTSPTKWCLHVTLQHPLAIRMETAPKAPRSHDNRKLGGQSRHGMRQLVFPCLRDSIIFATGASFMMGALVCSRRRPAAASFRPLLQTIAVAR
jgi:hypothetical protein